MPLTAAEGSISLAQEYLRTMLADSTSLRTWMGVGSQAAALARIYHEGLSPPPAAEAYTPAELASFRPFVLLWTDENAGGFQRRVAAYGTADQFEEGGVIHVLLEQAAPAAPTASDLAECDRRWRNTIGKIIDDLSGNTAQAGLSGVAGYLSIRHLTVLGPWRTPPDYIPTMGDAQQYEMVVTWGIGG